MPRLATGSEIAYISVGDGPPLVFASNIFGEATGYCTGFPHTREVTDRLVRLGSRVIRYDHRGMGASDRDVKDLSLEGRVRDLAAVVGHFGLRRRVGGVCRIGPTRSRDDHSRPCYAAPRSRFAGLGRVRARCRAVSARGGPLHQCRTCDRGLATGLTAFVATRVREDSTTRFALAGCAGRFPQRVNPCGVVAVR